MPFRFPPLVCNNSHDHGWDPPLSIPTAANRIREGRCASQQPTVTTSTRTGTAATKHRQAKTTTKTRKQKKQTKNPSNPRPGKNGKTPPSGGRNRPGSSASRSRRWRKPSRSDPWTRSASGPWKKPAPRPRPLPPRPPPRSPSWKTSGSCWWAPTAGWGRWFAATSSGNTRKSRRWWRWCTWWEKTRRSRGATAGWPTRWEPRTGGGASGRPGRPTIGRRPLSSTRRS
mmetsp:Transcript_3542/g.7746  ORF Transcript_3542/g.7746 Transcript_3542/m.7746 type:complete len:228 (-) Transcript_3542:697-1380(-)